MQNHSQLQDQKNDSNVESHCVHEEYQDAKLRIEDNRKYRQHDERPYEAAERISCGSVHIAGEPSSAPVGRPRGAA